MVAEIENKPLGDVLRDVGALDSAPPPKKQPRPKAAAPAPPVIPPVTPPSGFELPTDEPEAIERPLQGTLDACRAYLSENKGEIVAEYPYHNDEQELYYIVFRYIAPETPDQKEISQARSIKGEWRLEGLKQNETHFLYRMRDWFRSDRVVVVEGEKCVDYLHDAGIMATTSAGGSGIARNGQGRLHQTDWSHIQSCKEVYIWPDNDSPGMKYAHAVREVVDRMEYPPKLFLVEQYGEKGGDAADLIDDGLDPHEWIQNHSRPWGASADVIVQMEDEIQGKRKVLAFPWKILNDCSSALLPGTVTMLCGAPSSGKSFLIVQSLCHWKSEGVPYAALELEEDRPFWLRRMLMHLEGNSKITNPEWVRENPHVAARVRDEWGDWLDDAGRRIWAKVEEKFTLNNAVDWIEARAKEGNRVIVVDPISAAVRDRPPYECEPEFVSRVKQIAVDYQTSILLVTHPRKSQKPISKMDLDDLSGSADFGRFFQCVLWAIYHDPKNCDIRHVGEEQCNFQIRILKARNGRGNRASIGYWWNTGAMEFLERGVIQPRKAV